MSILDYVRKQERTDKKGKRGFFRGRTNGIEYKQRKPDCLISGHTGVCERVCAVAEDKAIYDAHKCV